MGKVPIDLLWKATVENDFPHTVFLAPPVVTCLHCAETLPTHHAPSVITCYTLDGPLPGAKITLRTVVFLSDSLVLSFDVVKWRLQLENLMGSGD